MAQFHDAPARYLDLMRQALPLYDRLQDELVAATDGLEVNRLLDLGAGTGETARRCMAAHPAAAVVVVDASERMLEIAGATLGEHVDVRRGRLEDPLPEGPFDLVASALAVHHPDGPGKADLFRRVAASLSPGGRFVMADVVVPEKPVAEPAPLDPAVDLPDRLDDLLLWLRNAGLTTQLHWAQQDLAVVSGTAGG
jgi:tRNA (cmo5U34)-methyltransferase